MPDIRIETRAATPIAAIRRVVKQPELTRVVPELCGRVWEHLKAQGIKGGHNVAVYLDGEMHIEVGVEVDGPFSEGGEVVRSATPAGRVASVLNVGPYSTLGAANKALKDWCAANGHKLAGPSWEIYGHWRPEWNANPSLIETEVCWLLA